MAGPNNVGGFLLEDVLRGRVVVAGTWLEGLFLDLRLVLDQAVDRLFGALHADNRVDLVVAGARDGALGLLGRVTQLASESKPWSFILDLVEVW